MLGIYYLGKYKIKILDIYNFKVLIRKTSFISLLCFFYTKN